MNTYRQTFWNDTPTSTTHLRDVIWAHRNQQNTGAFSLVFQHVAEQSKTRIVCRPGKASVARHERKGEVFERDHIICINNPPADVVQVVRPLVDNALVHAGNPAIGLPLTTTSPHLAGSVSLQSAQPGKALPQPARVCDPFPCRKRSQALQADIDANLRPTRRSRRNCIRQLNCQRHIPAPVAPSNLCMFDASVFG